MQMVGPWGRYLPQWLRAPAKGVAPPEAHSMQMVGPWGRYLPQWLRAPGNGSGPAICQHTHTHWTLPTTMSVLETPFDIQISSVYQRHTCMQAPIPTLCISAKKDSTHNAHPYAQVRYTSHLQSNYAVMRQLLLFLLPDNVQ